MTPHPEMVPPQRITVRDQLAYRKLALEQELQSVSKALDTIDANPGIIDLVDFITNKTGTYR